MPSAASHVCRHRRTYDLMLTLPDGDGWYDRCLSYYCAGCGDTADVAGSFNVRSAPWTLADLLRQGAQERRQGAALAQVAQREEALGRRAQKGRGTI